MKQKDTETDEEQTDVSEHRARVAALFEAERDKIVRYLQYRLRLSREEAQELAQEGYARLIRLHRRREVNNWAAYLWRTVQNLGNNRIKQLQTHQAAKPLIQDARHDHRTPESECSEEQANAAVLRAIAELPERLRIVATLLRKGRTTEQIAQALGVSERSCQRYQALAIVEIRRIIELGNKHERR